MGILYRAWLLITTDFNGRANCNHPIKCVFLFVNLSVQAQTLLFRLIWAQIEPLWILKCYSKVPVNVKCYHNAVIILAVKIGA